MTQEQVSPQNQKQSKNTEEEVAPQEETSQESKERQDKLTDDVEELLGEIDGVLSECAETEAEAQAWINAFVQKGGQ